MVDAVCVIPVNAEIFRCWFQFCKTVDRYVRIGDALRVGVFRYAPDTFDGRVGAYQFFYHVHIRSFRCHGYIDHLNAEIFGNGKMSVISRYRAQKFYFIEFAPGSAAHYAVSHAARNGIEHHI